MGKFSGEKLRQLRGRRTQTDLAHGLARRGFGTTQTQVSRWESGQAPRKYILPALAAELGVPVNELFEDADTEDDLSRPLTREVLRHVIRDELRAALESRAA